MRTSLKLAISSLIVFTVSSVATAQVDHQPLRIKIPFDFIAEDSKLPAGEYTVKPVSADRELITGKKGQVIAFAPAVLRGKPGSTAVLIFHQIGDQYFLAEVWPSGSSTGRLVGGSATTKRARETLVAQEVTVITGHR